MNQQVVPKGWHCRNLPTGEYAVLMPNQHVLTHAGIVPFLSATQQPLYLDITAQGGFKMAGQLWPDKEPPTPNKDHELEWKDGQWTVGPRVCVGVRPVIYDNAGKLHVSNGTINGRQTSQGYMGLGPDGEFLLADDFLAPSHGHDFHEWTELACGLVIGQRGIAGDEIQVWDGVVYRTVVSGMCRFPHRKEGIVNGQTVIAISCYRLQSDGQTVKDAVLTWATEAELRAMPEWVKPVPVAIAPNVPSFALAGMWLSDDSAPGNLAIGSPTYTVPRHTAVIATDTAIGAIPADRRVGLLVYLDQDDALATATIARLIPIAVQNKVPMFVYDDRRNGRFALVKQACGNAPFVWMPQWYLGIGEDPVSFAKAVIGLAQSYSGHPILPVIRAYCSLNTLGSVPFDAVPEDQVVAALNALITNGALKVPGFLGPIFFAWNRGDGILQRPLVKSSIDLWMQTPTTVTDARAWAEQFFPEVPTMNVPDYSADVKALYATDAFNFETDDGMGIFTDAVNRMLAAKDHRFGRLVKVGAQRNYNGYGVDAGLYLSDIPGQSVAVDYIQGSDGPVEGRKPSWSLDIPRYSSDVWRDPGPQPMSKVQRPALSFMLGMTGFDWGTHRDQGWLDLHTTYKLPVIRIVPQSIYRTPRTLTGGIAQLDAALAMLKAQGRKALVVINCDTKDFGMDRDAVRANTTAINAVMVKHLPAVAAASLCNENQNGNEQIWMTDPFFLLELDGLVDARIPLAWGCMFGRDVSPVAAGGSWIAHHSDRGLSPDENGKIMAAAQQKFGKTVVDQEPLGAAEPGTPGQRYFDPEYARQLGMAAKQYKLGGLIYHTQAGLRASVAEFGKVHRAGAVALIEGLGETVVKPPGPPPVTPPSGDPVLDVDFRRFNNGVYDPNALSDAGYILYVNNWAALKAAIIAWGKKATGIPPAESDINQIVLRLLVERNRQENGAFIFNTPRAAMKNKWPGGAAA